MNNRRLPLYLAGALAAGGVMTAATLRIGEYRTLPPAQLTAPAVPDTIQNDNPFSADKLLGVRKQLPAPDAKGVWSTATADTAGRITFAANHGNPVLHTLTTRIKADRFAKGKLLLSSTSRATVKVDDQTLISKATSDSLPTDAEAPLSLNPETVYDITVDLLSMPDDKSASDFRLEFVPDKDFEDVAVSCAPSLSRRVGPSTTATGERVTSATLSPDGKYLLVAMKDVKSATESSSRALLTETATGRVISEDVNPEAAWLPRGNALYYTAKRNGVSDVYKMEIPSMATSLLAKDVPDENFVISPDMRYLFYYDVVEGNKDAGIMRRVKSPDDRIPGDRDRYYLVRYDLESHLAVPVTYGGPSTSITAYSQDGSKLLYIAQRQQPDTYPFYFMSLVEMDINTLRTDTLIKEEQGFITDARYSPDASQIFITAHPEAFGGIGANYAPHPIANNFDHQGFILDKATGKVRAMTRDFAPSLEGGAVWNHADGKIYFRAETGFDNFIYRLDPSDGKIIRIGTSMPYVKDFSMGDNESKWIAYRGGSFTDDGVAALVNLKTGKETIVADPQKENVRDIEFGKMEQWKFTASDGTEIDGYFCLPPGFDPQKKYPMIVYYYGGTAPTTSTFYHLYSPQTFASRDYVVYLINPSGTTGYGQEFSARHVNAWGKRTAEDIIEGVKLFCKEHSFVNDKKIGCIGASYGGFMTQYLQTLTDIFAAAVSHAGISNVTSYWGEGFWGYSYNSVAAAKSYPWTDPELFTKQGSLFNADKIHTPLLLLHGTVDTNVPIGESIQLFNALRILGRDVEFITVQDENHVVAGFESRIVWQNTIMAWFAKWLQDDPRWWNELYGK